MLGLGSSALRWPRVLPRIRLFWLRRRARRIQRGYVCLPSRRTSLSLRVLGFGAICSGLCNPCFFVEEQRLQSVLQT